MAPCNGAVQQPVHGGLRAREHHSHRQHHRVRDLAGIRCHDHEQRREPQALWQFRRDDYARSPALHAVHAGQDASQSVQPLRAPLDERLGHGIRRQLRAELEDLDEPVRRIGHDVPLAQPVGQAVPW